MLLFNRLLRYLVSENILPYSNDPTNFCVKVFIVSYFTDQIIFRISAVLTSLMNNSHFKQSFLLVTMHFVFLQLMLSLSFLLPSSVVYYNSFLFLLILPSKQYPLRSLAQPCVALRISLRALNINPETSRYKLNKFTLIASFFLNKCSQLDAQSSASRLFPIHTAYNSYNLSMQITLS